MIAPTPVFRRTIQQVTVGEWDRFRLRARSRPVRSIREFAEQCIVIPDGPFRGQRFRCDRQPWTTVLFDQIDNAVWPEIVATAPAQCGKTLVLFVIPLLWAAVELRQNCVVGLPDEEMWGDKWQVDILPVLVASPELRHLLPTKGPGSRDGKPKEAVTLTNGVVLKPMTPSGGEHTRSGFTAPIVSVTELYRFDGSPFGELKARQGAYNRFASDGRLTTDRRLFAEGTLTNKRSLPWSIRSTDDPDAPAISTESELQAPCPHCGRYTQWEREHLVGWHDADNELQAARLARWECPECHVTFGDDERRQAAARLRLVHRGQHVDDAGQVIGQPPEVSRLFFRVSGFQNLLVNTSELGAEEWEASQLDPESPAGIDREEYLTTKKWALPFEPPVLDFMPLRASWIRDNRRGLLPLNTLPPETQYYCVGIDLGKFTCWYVGMSFTDRGAISIVSFGGVDTSLTQARDDQATSVDAAVHSCLERIFDDLDQGLPCGGEMRQPDMVFVDSGWHTNVAFSTCKARRAIPIIGRGKSQFKSREYAKPTATNSTVRKIGDGWYLSYIREQAYYQITLDADRSKLDVQSGVRVEPGKPGSITLPRSINQRDLTKLCAHLAAEVRRQTRDESGRLVEEWVQTRGRHDLLDCAGYALVAGRYCQAVEELHAAASQRQKTEFQAPGGVPFLASER